MTTNNINNITDNDKINFEEKQKHISENLTTNDDKLSGVDVHIIDKNQMQNNNINKSKNNKHTIIEEAKQLFMKHWYDKNESYIIKLATHSVSSDDAAKNILQMLKSLNIKISDLKTLHVQDKSSIKQTVDICFQLKCTDVIDKLENTKTFSWIKIMNESDIAALECIAVASINLNNEDLSSVTRMILKNQEIWNSHFNAEGFMGYIKHLGKDPMKRKHQAKLLNPIQNLIHSLQSEDKNANYNNSDISEHTANFILLSKLLQKCLKQILHRNKWITSDGINAYKTNEVQDMFKLINSVYMSLPHNDPSSSLTHVMFYNVLLRRCSLVNLWISLTVGKSK